MSQLLGRVPKKVTHESPQGQEPAMATCRSYALPRLIAGRRNGQKSKISRRSAANEDVSFNVTAMRDIIVTPSGHRSAKSPPSAHKRYATTTITCLVRWPWHFVVGRQVQPTRTSCVRRYLGACCSGPYLSSLIASWESHDIARARETGVVPRQDSE
jgi:hypothetical protein